MTLNEQKLLGLSKREAATLKALRRQSLSVSALSRETAIPKTTLNYLVRKLAKRGFLISLPHRRRQLWALDVKNKFNSSSGFNQPSEIKIPISPETTLEIYRGAKNIFKLWQKLSASPGPERFYAIQPDKSFNQAMERLLDKTPYEDLVEINSRFKKHKIIVDGIVHERSADTVPKTITKKGYDPARFIAGFPGRIAATVKLPDDFMDLGVEMFIRGKMFVVIYWADELGLVINNREVVSFFKEMFQSVKFLCKRYDQGERMAQKLVELSRSAQSGRI